MACVMSKTGVCPLLLCYKIATRYVRSDSSNDGKAAVVVVSGGVRLCAAVKDYMSSWSEGQCVLCIVSTRGDCPW
jgi:hypothetical protein